MSRMKLNHVALTVTDRERSAAFYGEHFGLVQRVHEDHHLLIVGSADTALVALTEGTPPADLPRTNHFGFQCENGEAVHEARSRLAAKGLRETEWQDDEFFVRVQVADPDGYLIDLYAY